MLLRLVGVPKHFAHSFFFFVWSVVKRENCTTVILWKRDPLMLAAFVWFGHLQINVFQTWSDYRGHWTLIWFQFEWSWLSLKVTVVFMRNHKPLSFFSHFSISLKLNVLPQPVGLLKIILNLHVAWSTLMGELHFSNFITCTFHVGLILVAYKLIPFTWFWDKHNQTDTSLNDRDLHLWSQD